MAYNSNHQNTLTEIIRTQYNLIQYNGGEKADSDDDDVKSPLITRAKIDS